MPNKLKRTVFLVHWKAEEAGEKAKLLKNAGHDVVYRPITPAILKAMKTDPPDAVVIDLSRVPSQGREIAVNLRQAKATRHIPIVFVEGETDKLARIKALLPDAEYTTWENIKESLDKAIKYPPANPVAMKTVFDAYIGTPLFKKLGIVGNMTVVLIDPPSDHKKILGRLPAGSTAVTKLKKQNEFVIWFVRSSINLRKFGDYSRVAAKTGRLWVAWPKKSSGIVSDLSQTAVRRAGLATGMVDCKICAIDDTWSALLFTWPKDK
ncbi:conserved hypothetical protein [Candidatus Zixiibacteriota bacterium]|nr:conserved hypothetical protein [candidate division Zixibacteria bacterium]